MKSRIRSGDPQRQRYWEEVLRRWKEGGQTVRAFCRAEKVRESAFYFWRRKLTRRGRQAPKRAAAVAKHPLSFLPVHLVDPRVIEPARGVEIVLEQGRTVRVPPGFDRQTLADVLALLEVRPC
jgi:transposase-like protein